MKIKAKIALGIGTLFIVMLAILIVNTYYLRLLAEDASAVNKDNQVSMDHVQNMQQALAYIHLSSDNKSKKNAAHTESFEQNLYAALNNVTEKGEKEALQGLRDSYSEYKKFQGLSPNFHATNGNPDSANHYFFKIHQQLKYIHELNRNAILEKNQKATNTASLGIKITTVIGTLFTIIAFTFLVNFPGYIANPINELSEKINAIARRNFNQQLDISSKDEFGALANSFNYMAKQLQEYQKSSVADLVLEKKRIESIINNLDEGICLLDADQNIIVANPAMGRISDMHELVMIGKPLSHFAETTYLFKNIQENLNTTYPSTIGISINQEEQFYQLKVQQVYTYNDLDKTNQLSGYVILLKNVTEFRKKDIAKTNFLANVSHELKTPLSSINLSLKLLHDQRIGHLSTEQEHLVSNISHESQRLLKFVNELLEFTRNETGNIRLRLEKVNPAQIIQYSVEAIKPTLEQAEVQLKIENQDHLPPVMADMEKTVWVLTNLLSNAVRYGPVKGIILIKSKARQNEVVFTVTDMGKGIEEKYHSQIFQRFTQVNDKDNKGPGTGLGLAIAKDFIEAQNGRIWVESEPGRGSTFSFTLQSAQ